MIGNVKYINEYGNAVEFAWKPFSDVWFAVESFTGFTENHVNLGASQGFNQIGDTVLSRSVQSKPMSCTGLIMGDANIGAALLLNTILPGVKGKLIYNDTWELPVDPTSTPTVSKHKTTPHFQFELKAAYPYWRKTEESVTMMTGIEAAFEWWDLTQPYEFGIRIDKGFSIITNEGSVETPYTVIFRSSGAGVVGPRIVNAMTYEFLGLNRNYHMEPGEVIKITILPDGITVTSTKNRADSDAIGYFDITSNLYRLRPGANIISHDATAGRDSLDIDIVNATESAWVR